MTDSISTVGSSILSILTEGPLASLTQEFLVLVVFFGSLLAWRRLSSHQRRLASRGGSKLREAADDNDDEASKACSGAALGLPAGRAGSGGAGATVARQRQAPAATTKGGGAAGGTTCNAAMLQASEEQMLKHLEVRQFTRALNMYRALERNGRDLSFSEELYSAFIQSAIRVGKGDVVERMLHNMKREGMRPSLRFWQTVFKMLSSRKHFTVCLTVHTIFGKQLPTDKVVFSCLVNAALEVGSPERAAQMLERFAQADIDPKDHVLFFRTYVCLNDVGSAETVFQKLGNQNTALMLNLLLLTCVNTKELERGLGLLRQAHELEKTASERIVDVVSYNTLIKGFAQGNSREKCFQCLHDMREHGLEPDDITLSTLLDACILDNDRASADKITDLLMGSNKHMDTVVCTLFIKGLVRANCLPKALEIYEEMTRQEEASRPDLITYSVLIKALVDQHDLDRALELVEDLRTAGLSVDDIILTHLLEGCRHAGDHARGKKLFSDSLASGVKPSEYTLVTMLKLHGRCSAHKEAYDLVAGWEKLHGTKPSVIHYTCLVSGCLRTKNYDQAWSAYNLMCDNGIVPDETAVSTLLPGMVAAQEWEKVLQIADRALQGSTKMNIPPETLNNALSQMVAHGGDGLLFAGRLRALMREALVPVTARNAKRVQP